MTATPGPWDLRGNQIRAEGGLGRHVGSYTSNRADGRLMAAAPALRSALVALLAEADEQWEEGCGYDGISFITAEALDHARAALAACELTDEDRVLYPE